MAFMRYGRWKQGPSPLGAQAVLAQQVLTHKGAAGKGHSPRKKSKTLAAERRAPPREQRGQVQRLRSMATAAVDSGSRPELGVLTEEQPTGPEHTLAERGGSLMEVGPEEQALQLKTFD